MKKLTSVLAVALVTLIVICLPALAQPAAPKDVYPRSLKLSKGKATIINATGKNNVLRLQATTVPAQGTLTDGTITWTSDDETIATVDQTGVVTPVGEGLTRVRASIQGLNRTLTVSCRVTVKAVRVSSLAISDQAVALDNAKAGERTHQLTYTILPATATFQRATFTSSDSSVATVDENGVVTAVAPGSAKITVSADNGRKKLSCTVRVRDQSKMVSITISAGGDIVLGGDPLKKTDVRFEQLISQSGTPDYGYVLKNLKSVFSKDDVTILNLEGPLKGRANPRKPHREYNFYGKPEYAQILVEGSVEVANIVNNHINDYGTKTQTKQILRDHGIVRSDSAFSVANNSIVVKGVRVGFVGFQTPTSGVRGLVRKAKAACDMVVVSFHWGEIPEHTYKVRSTQIKAARTAIDAGADLVIGHHPHEPSGIEVYKGKYIYYGIGAVMSSGKLFKYPNFIMQQEFLVDVGTGYTESKVPYIYPISPTSRPQTEDNDCQPIFLTPDDSRHAKVLRIIDKYSVGGGLNPAPYIVGSP